MIGPMRHRLEIQTASASPNAYGEPILTWSTVATRWGSIDPLAGRELWQARQVSPDVSHKVTLRYYAGLTPKCRLVFGSRTFEVESVLTIDERKRFMVCVCHEEL